MVLITESRLRTMLKTGIPNPYPIHEGDTFTPAATDFLKERGIQLKPSDLTRFSYQTDDIVPNLLIPTGVSNRHVHLSPEDVENLFGSRYTLTPFRDLSQPGQYAAEEKVTLLGPKGFIQGVRILGPPRGATQIEISKTDGFQLGVHPPVRLSGSIEDTPGITLIGPNSCVSLEKGVIVAKCHVHMSPNDAEKFKVEHGDHLMLKTMGERSITFTDVIVRVSPNYVLDFHIDLDEANAANLKTGDTVKIIGKNNKLLSRDGGEEYGDSGNGRIYRT